MRDLDSLPIIELEALCKQDELELFRHLHGDNLDEYRGALIEHLARPTLPVDEIFEALCAIPDPVGAWRNALSACMTRAPRAPWDQLPALEIERDITVAQAWLGEQFRRIRGCTRVYIGLDTGNMCGGHGTNVEIAGSAVCDPFSNSVQWLARPLRPGDPHLIRGLYDLRRQYSRGAWRVDDDAVATGSYFAFADYTLSPGYSGLVLGHALSRTTTDWAFLVVWGFHDGDMFPLGRVNAGEFIWLWK
jgi:hypothetical protein